MFGRNWSTSPRACAVMVERETSKCRSVTAFVLTLMFSPPGQQGESSSDFRLLSLRHGNAVGADSGG